MFSEDEGGEGGELVDRLKLCTYTGSRERRKQEVL